MGVGEHCRRGNGTPPWPRHTPAAGLNCPSERETGKEHIFGSSGIESKRPRPLSESWFRRRGFTEELLCEPSGRCNPLSAKVLLGLSHYEIAPEFGIEPFLGLW